MNRKQAYSRGRLHTGARQTRASTGPPERVRAPTRHPPAHMHACAHMRMHTQPEAPLINDLTIKHLPIEDLDSAGKRDHLAVRALLIGLFCGCCGCGRVCGLIAGPPVRQHREDVRFWSSCCVRMHDKCPRILLLSQRRDKREGFVQKMSFDFEFKRIPPSIPGAPQCQPPTTAQRLRDHRPRTRRMPCPTSCPACSVGLQNGLQNGGLDSVRLLFHANRVHGRVQ